MGGSTKIRRDLTGQIFGRLTVVSRAENRYGRVHWLCICICGIERVVPKDHLLQGATRSYGCLNRDLSRERATKHNQSGTIEYRAWAESKTRCFNPAIKCAKDYSERGITMCHGLRDSFELFLRIVGLKPTKDHSIDRIHNDGHYSCGECVECTTNNWSMNIHWATKAEQSRNRRSNIYLTLGVETMILTDWAKRKGMEPSTLSWRIKRGWSVERALLTPVR